MKASARSAIGLLALVSLISSSVPATEAVGQDRKACWIVRNYATGFLRQCDNRLHLFTLSIDEIRRTGGGDFRGRFGFACPIEPMCAEEPDIIGWFIDPAIWLQSERDESAVFDVLNSAGPALHARGPLPPRPQPACEVFEAQISDMKGRGVCYEFPESQSTWVVVVMADADVGFALLFQQRSLDGAGLRDNALRTLKRSRIERATGDAALLRWMK